MFNPEQHIKACADLMSICRRNVVILCSQIGSRYYKVHVEVCVVVLKKKKSTCMSKLTFTQLFIRKEMGGVPFQSQWHRA